jgi:hypothetical protein
MHIVQDYSVLYNNTVRPVICGLAFYSDVQSCIINLKNGDVDQ